jgi:Flp pilus assembly protein TadG
MVEMALLAPWVFLLFIGALDWGFYAYALICLQDAARSAALYTSSGPLTAGDSATACTIALKELEKLPNIGSSASPPCSTNPIVTATEITGADSPDSNPASKVVVTYQTIRLIPIPGLLNNQFTITRVVKMRERSST